MVVLIITLASASFADRAVERGAAHDRVHAGGDFLGFGIEHGLRRLQERRGIGEALVVAVAGDAPAFDGLGDDRRGHLAAGLGGVQPCGRRPDVEAGRVLNPQPLLTVSLERGLGALQARAIGETAKDVETDFGAHQPAAFAAAERGAVPLPRAAERDLREECGSGGVDEGLGGALLDGREANVGPRVESADVSDRWDCE